MPLPQIDLALLNDDARWADPYDCAEPLFAGVLFLHDCMLARFPKCPLLKRIVRLGDQFNAMYATASRDRSLIRNEHITPFVSELDLLGTLGHSLWHLKEHLMRGPFDMS